MNEIVNGLVVVYFALVSSMFLLSIRHFYGWFLNSTPPMGRLGPLVEIFSMLSDRYLTTDGRYHKAKCIKWLLITIGLGGGALLIAYILEGSHVGG